MKIWVVSLVELLFGLIGCVGAQEHSVPDVRSLAWLKGGTSAQIFARYGSHTASDETYPASEAAGELRAPIRVMFPPDQPESRNTSIREVWWRRGDRYTSVFFRRQQGRWIVVDAVEWQKDVVF